MAEGSRHGDPEELKAMWKGADWKAIFNTPNNPSTG
jgi:hypothetical protein